MLSRSRNMKLSSKLVLLIFISLVCIYIILSVFWFVILEIQARMIFIRAGYDMCALGGQMAEQECSYLQGIAAYLSVSSRTQGDADEEATQTCPCRETTAWPQSWRHLKYPVSVIFFDLQGEPVDWMSIEIRKRRLPRTRRVIRRFRACCTDRRPTPGNSSTRAATDSSPATTRPSSVCVSGDRFPDHAAVGRRRHRGGQPPFHQHGFHTGQPLFPPHTARPGDGRGRFQPQPLSTQRGCLRPS